MSKGHPFRYDQGPYERHRSRYPPQDGRRDVGSPYKRQRRSSSSANDFTTFTYEDYHQEVGLGNFNDFSAINRESILPRDRRRDGKPPSSQPTSSLSVQTTRANAGSKSTSKTSPLSVNVSLSGHTPNKPSTSSSSASGSLLSSFHHPDRQSTYRSFGSQPNSPYKSGSISAPQYSARPESSQSAGQSAPVSYQVNKTNPPTGLLMQASSADVNTSYAVNRTVSSVKEDVYQPKVEAVSPTNSETEAEKGNNESSKEADNKTRTSELLKQMEKVDKEISEAERKITELQEKQKTLEDELSQDPLSEEEEQQEEENGNEVLKEENGTEEKDEAEVVSPEPKEKSLIERIYEENRKKAAEAHERFAKIGIPLPTMLPLYNQPSDLPFYEENRKKARTVQLKLVKYFQRKRKDKQIKQRALLEQYRVLHKKWVEKVEKIENNQKRKNKEARVRDFYEKIFPEIKRHREQTERFSRIGSRTNWGMSVRSDAEYEEILRDLEEKERTEKHMRQLAVDIPPLLDEDQRRVKYINKNGFIKDLKVYVEQRNMLNIWTEKEKETFKEKYIEAPKDFEYIAKFIPNKNVKDCILYYYRTKRTGNFKKLAKKQTLKRKRMSNSASKDETSKSKILKPRPEGDRSESEIEDEEAFEMDSDGSEESSLRIPISTSTNLPVKISTPQTGSKAVTEASSAETPRWSKNEREIAIEGLRLHGRNWTAISQMVKTKTEAQCKNFYFNYKRKLDLENVIAEHNALKVVQRQESEETISASEASDDNYDIPEERPSLVRSKQNARETRSQVAERRAETGPILRNTRSQRNTRNKSADGKPSRGLLEDPSDAKLHEVENTVAVEESKISTAGSDETRIIVVDTVEPPTQNEVAGSIVGSREHSRTQVSPIESYAKPPTSTSASEVTNVTDHSTTLARPPPAVTKGTSSDRQPSQISTKVETSNPRIPDVDLTSTTESLKSPVIPTSTMYPKPACGPLSMETGVSGRHSEALLNLARNRAAAETAGLLDNPLEDLEEKNEKEKLKKNRFPDPQLRTFEQSEAQRIFNRFSPCIPPDTTSRQQVRTQRHPHPSFHPPGIPMHPFVPHLGPHGVPHFPEMYAIAMPPGPGFEPIFHPQFVEYFSPGMEQHLFSARLREEAARANSGAVLWPPPMEHQGIVFTPHPPFMIPMEPLPPTERIPRRRESGHEITSPVSSPRCRSVEMPTIHPRARTPDQVTSNSKPVNQQRSTSLTDVHSWVASGSGERHTSPNRPQAAQDTDQVKSFERFNALMNVAAGAKPIVESIRETQRARDSVKISEADRSHTQFTRQSCVVTNTAVLHVSSGPKDASGSQAHGISSGLAPPQPPPLLSITGTQPPRSEGVSKLTQVINSREMNNAMDPRHGATASFSHTPKEQQPPPLVRDAAPPIGLRRTPPSKDIGLLGRSNQDLLPCGCRSTEPCKHQLYSQEVPYLQQADARDRREVERKQQLNIEPSNRKSIFRPWTENITNDSTKPSSPLKTVSPPIQLKHTGSSFHSHSAQKRLSGSPVGGGRTPPPSVISHPYSQPPGVLIPHPHPSSQELGEVLPRPEAHTRSSHRKDDVVSQERGPRSVLVPQDVTPRPSFTPQGPTSLTPQGSATSHQQRPPDSSLVLHPPPHSVASRNKSPQPQQSRRAPSSSQPSNPSTPHNSRESSIIKSSYPPPLMSGVPPNTPQGTQPTPPISRFSHLSGTSHPSPVVLGMTSVPHQLNLMPHPFPNEQAIQEPRGPSTLIQSRATHPTPFPTVLSSHHAPLPPDLLHSGNISHMARDSARLTQPFEQFRSSPEQSHAVLEHSRTFFEQSHLSSEPTRSSIERSIVSADYSSPVVSKSISPGPQSVGPGPHSVGQGPQTVSAGHGLAKQPPLVGNTIRPKSPFIEQAELHQSSFDTPVDIQRHVNPSYAKKTAAAVSSDSRKDITKSPASSPKKQDAGKLSPSPHMNTVFEQSSGTMATGTARVRDMREHTIESDVAPHPRDVASNPRDVTSNPRDVTSNPRDVTSHPQDVTSHPRDVTSNPRDVTSNPRDVTSHPRDADLYPDEETFESREDSRSFAESSSVGFESPDDEDHELRMRYFPSDDISDSGGDGLYEIRDSHQCLESEGGGDPNKGENVGGTSERHASEDEFSNTDATCIPTDSTYIAYSERSTDESVRIRHGYDSPADMVDSTVSDFPDFEQPSEGGESEDRKQGEPRRGGNDPEEFSSGESLGSADGNIVSGRSLTEQPVAGENPIGSDSWKDTSGKADEKFDKSVLNDDDIQPGDTRLMSLQDETVSGNEGDDDATEDEAGYSGIEIGSTSGVVVSNRAEVVDKRTDEVDSSEVIEKVDVGDLSGSTREVVDKDDCTVIDRTISVDARHQVENTAVGGNKALFESMEDTSAYDEDNVVHDRVSEGTQSAAAHDQASELKGNLKPDVTGVLEDERLETAQEGVSQIRDKTESLNSADKVLTHTGTEEDVITADFGDSVDSRAGISTADTRNFLGGPASTENAEEACTTEEAVTTTEEDASDMDSELESNVQSAIDDMVDTSENDNTLSTRTTFTERGSEDVKDVSSSSDTNVGEGSRKVEQSDDENDIMSPHTARGIDSSKKDEGLSDVTDGVDSSTDRGDTRDDYTQKESPCFVQDDASADQSADCEDMATSSNESEKSSEEHVTSTDECAKERDQRVICEDDHRDRDEQVTSGDELVTGGGEQLTDQYKQMADQDEHVTSGDEHVTSGDEHVISGEERVDSQTTDDQNDPKEDNEVENNRVETEEDRSEEIKVLSDVNAGIGLDNSREGVAVSVDDGTVEKLEEHGRKEVQEASGGSPTIESTSSPGQANIFMESSSSELLQNQKSSNQDTQEGQNVSTTGSNVNDSFRDDDVIESTLEEASYTNRGIQGEQSPQEVDENITSTVGAVQGQVVSKHDDADISSSLELSRGDRHPEPDNGETTWRPCVSTSSSGAEQRDDVASSSGVAMQRDDVVTDSDAPRVFDVSSSDTSGSLENTNEAESRSSPLELPDSAEDANQAELPNNSSEMDYPDSAENATEAISPISSSEVDLPDSAHILDRRPSDSNDLKDQDLGRFSRRSSGDSTSHSDEPSTTNFDETTASISATGNRDKICGNEAESYTRYQHGKIRIERISEGDSLDEKDNFVDSSTVSPVSFTDDVSPADASLDVTGHVGAIQNRTENPCDDTVDTTGYLVASEENIPGERTADTTEDLEMSRDNVVFTTENIVGTTGYLAVNRDLAESTNENVVDTTEYLGLNKDNASTSDNSVGTTGYFGMNVDNSASLSMPEDTVGSTMSITSSCKYDITVEEISSDEELEEGEIAETPNVATVNDVTPCDISPEHAITSSSGSYYPPLDTIPISPPADSNEPTSSFLDFVTYTYSPTQHAGSSTPLSGSSTLLSGSSRVSHSVFPFSALNVRSAPNSNCSSPVPVRFSSGCSTPITYQQADSTPIRFQPADSSSLLTPQYEPLSDDESSESHGTSDGQNSSSRDTDSS